MFHTMTGYFLNSFLLFHLILTMVSNGTKGTLVLEFQSVDSTAYTEIPCSDTFTFTETSGRVDIRRPTLHENAFSDCYCLLYPHNGDEWPIQGTVRVQYLEGNNWIFWEDYNYNYFKTGYSGSYSYAIQFEYHEANSLHTLQIIYNTLEEFRYMTMKRIFAFVPDKIRLDISCSPWSYWDARTGMPRTSANPTVAENQQSPEPASHTLVGVDKEQDITTPEGEFNSSGNKRQEKANNGLLIGISCACAVLVLIVISLLLVIYFMKR